MSILKSLVVGAWILVSFEQESEDGEIAFPLGNQAKGSIYYLPNGYMSVHIMDINRSENVDEQLYKDKQLKYSQLGYLAYSGRYQIDEESCIMTHNVDISLYPEWIAGEQVRHIKLDGDQLLLSSIGPVGPQKIQFRLFWKRAANDNTL
jgi:hypothetical protein